MFRRDPPPPTANGPPVVPWSERPALLAADRRLAAVKSSGDPRALRAALDALAAAGDIIPRPTNTQRNRDRPPKTTTETSARADVRQALYGLGYAVPTVAACLATLPESDDAAALLRAALRDIRDRR
jgi:Holliday junction resolvasome RuvABC DNA-binding subunit